MSNEEFTRNEETLAKLHELLQNAITDGKTEDIEKLSAAIQKLESQQTEAEKASGDYDIEIKKIEESKKQFKTQVVTTVGTTVGLGVFGYILERTGGLVTVEPLKVFLKSLSDSVLHPFKKH